jgi:hypothetical protein
MKPALLRHRLARRGLIGALAVLTAAGMVAGREKPGVAIAEPPAQRIEKAQALPAIDLDRLKRAQAAAPASDPFAPRSFAPPPTPQAQAAAEPPSAPPLPFAYAGKLTQDGRTETFVLRGDELISIAAGHKIDEHYRVDAISASSIAFTYLPLKMRQSLELEEAGG